ncbi:MAG: stage V sporulation T C-terminal domain-containing protein [Christensenellales bacterium]
MVRKVDELGRVVVPKEMRRVLGIKPGSSVEMSIDTQNNVVLKKFSEIENLEFFAQIVADVLFEVTGNPVCVCDDEKVVACKGISKKLIDENSIMDICAVGKLDNIEYAIYKNCFLREIKSDGSVCGYIIMMSNKEIGQDVKKICEVASIIFAKTISS